MSFLSRCCWQGVLKFTRANRNAVAAVSTHWGIRAVRAGGWTPGPRAGPDRRRERLEVPAIQLYLRQCQLLEPSSWVVVIPPIDA